MMWLVGGSEGSWPGSELSGALAGVVQGMTGCRRCRRACRVQRWITKPVIRPSKPWRMGVVASPVPAVMDLLTGWRLVTSIAGVLAVAAVASRLLGTRRSLGSVAVSGLFGWAA